MFPLELIYAWTASSLILSWLLAYIYPLLRPWILKLSAVSASQIILFVSLLPVITVSSVLLLYSQPALNAYLVEDHCHGEICGPHWLFLPTSSSISTGIEIVVIALLLIFSITIIRQSIKGHKYWQLLRGLTEKQSHLPYRVVNTQRPTAWCAGLWNTEIYMTQGLIDKLSPEQIRIVWAHEHCHGINKDNLRKSLVYWFTLHWPRKAKHAIGRDLSDQLELSCDLAAVHSLHGMQEFEQTINLLEKYCSRDEPLTDYKVKERAEQLRVELKKVDELSQLSVLKSWLISIASMVIFAVWLIIIAGLLHPILEWISA